jgi:hypothetical protein
VDASADKLSVDAAASSSQRALKGFKPKSMFKKPMKFVKKVTHKISHAFRV